MRRPPRIVILTGGVGGSKFVVGVRDEMVARHGIASLQNVTAVINTGDDLWLSGLRLQPDVDSVIYALAGVKDEERGWGRADESEVVAGELGAWGAGWPWFTLGDRDLGAHIARTGWLREGRTPSAVVEALAARWSVGVRLVPATDQEVDTRVVVLHEGRTVALHFQEWWTRYRASLPVVRFENPGIDSAVPAPGVADSIAEADLVLVAPSNPVVSIGPIVSVPGIAEALRATEAAVIGVSPVIGGVVVRGMADVCLAAIGVETDAAAVGAHYGSRASGGLLDTFFIDDVDATRAPALSLLGLSVFTRSIWMRSREEASELAGAVLDAC